MFDKITSASKKRDSKNFGLRRAVSTMEISRPMHPRRGGIPMTTSAQYGIAAAGPSSSIAQPAYVADRAPIPTGATQMEQIAPFALSSGPGIQAHTKSHHHGRLATSGPVELSEHHGYNVAPVNSPAYAQHKPKEVLATSADSNSRRVPVPSKRSHFTPSHIFSRVSSAFDRRAPRVDESRNKASLKRSSVATMDMSFDEGDDVSKKPKLPKLVAGQSRLKLASGSRRILRSERSLEKEDSELPELTRSLLEPESMYETFDEYGADNGGLYHDPHEPMSPFNIEEGFEDDIETRILVTIPEGASTPRETTKTTFLASISTPEKQSLLGNANHVDRNGSDTSMEINIQLSNSLLLDGQVRTKKHPSPSRATLRVLRAQLDFIFLRTGTLANNDDIDELARSLMSLDPAVVARRGRRAPQVAIRSHPSSGMELSAHRRISRVPRSVIFRPSTVDADREDELI
ncbi:hypothetical protein N3K66_004603 [Trichothecium roseum]|uniref:Uncharacterized protein n=1 Tax=Trichothecium roseum TaxID=47278 RepID=A0ACC0V2G9_9HYPO|nr:hypothetical protein N3K66_004603 [Trichothecium roseum]